MRPRLALFALLLLTGTTGLGQTVRDKVYSQPQAKQGLATYDDQCATCHDGGTMGPELWGDAFLAEWESKDLAAFYKRIKESMPENRPGSLSEDEVLGLIAFVLQQNGFPAGDKAMESASALAGVKFAVAR